VLVSAFIFGGIPEKAMITPKEVRKFGDMGNTKSEIVLTSNLLRKWVNAKKIEKVRKGTYRIIKREEEKVSISKLMDLLRDRKL